MVESQAQLEQSHLDKWQETIDLMRQLFDVPAALLMQVHPNQIEVLIASQNKDNPYEPGEMADLGTGLYCETVMATRELLQVPHALKDPIWQKNPDIALNMFSYLGVPICRPNGDIFGTICVLDQKERTYSKNFHLILGELRKIIEADLRMAEVQDELVQQIEHREKAEIALRRSHEDLEILVRERTLDLEEKNIELGKRIKELQQLKNAVEKSSDTILVFDREENILYTNPAFTDKSGYKSSEVLGKNLSLLWANENDPGAAKDMWEVLSAGHVWKGTILSQHKTGSTYFEEIAISPIGIEWDAPHSYVAVQRDISERIKNQEERERLARSVEEIMKGQALATLTLGLAYELENILHSIYIHGSALSSLLADNSNVAHHVHAILKSGEEAHDLISKLLIVKGPEQQLEETADLAKMVNKIVLDISGKLPENIDLDLNLGEGRFSVQCDKNSVSELLAELVSNSEFAIGEQPGKIDVTLKRVAGKDDTVGSRSSDATSVELIITDNGCGMNQETLRRARDPFFTTRPRTVHRGLGLTIVNHLVNQWEGDLRLESVPTEGTRVRITLPLLD